MNEQNDREQREQRSKSASQQPELTPAQEEETSPARAAGGRETRFFVTVSVCSHMAPRGGSGCLDTLIPSLFRESPS